MKKIICIILLISILNLLTAQNNSVSIEKNIFGIQFGLMNLNLYNEVKLDKKFALRSELGFNLGFYGNSNSTEYLIAPAIKLEPRYYFGLNRRDKLGKNIKNNGANFLSLKSVYQTDLILYSF